MRPFFYWVHKTLPLVYDDSLSYMELLSKVLYHLNRDTEKINQISELLAKLTEYVNNYLGSDEFEQMISDKLDEMAEDGTLDLMLSEIAASSKFVPSETEHSAYVAGVSAAIADWFAHMAPGSSDSVVGSPVSTAQTYAALYSDDYDVGYPNLLTYDAIVDDVWTFGKDPSRFPDTPVDSRYDSLTVGGLSHPVMYMNCSGFVTMITKGRSYQFSPWAKLYADSSATGRDLALRCMEYGTMHDTPWTFDFMNVLYTWRMAAVMKGSGCTPKLVAKNTAGVLSVTDDLKYLRDGDILFFGNPDNVSYADRYLSAHHCAIYFKTLDALNAAATALNFSFKPWDNSTATEHGFMVHCTGGSGEGTNRYRNVLRVDTLDSYMSGSNANEEIYGCQAAANALNSSKEHLIATGILTLFNCDMIPGVRENYAPGAASMSLNTVRAFQTGTSNGTFSYGLYRYQQPTISIAAANSTVDLNDLIGPKQSGLYVIHANNVTIVHGPTSAEVVEGEDLLESPTSIALQLDVQDCYQADGLTVQTLTLVSVSPHKWERTINSSGNSSKWFEIF